MLVIQRRVGEGFTLVTPEGRRCRLVVIDASRLGGSRPQVRFGIEATKEDFLVLRDELERPPGTGSVQGG